MSRKLFVNASFITLNPEQPRANALLVEDGHIRGVGEEKALRRDTDGAELVDLEGAVVVPGLIDSHVHAAWTGMAEVAVDLFNASTLSDVYAALQARASETPPGELIVAMRLEWRFLTERRWPTADEIDAIVPEHPVVFLHRTGHEMWVNRMAFAQMRLAGLLPAELPGIERDSSGDVTGLLTDRANTAAGDYFLMRYGRELGWESVLRAAAVKAARFGLTSLHALDPIDVIEALLPVLRDLPIRVVPYAEETDIERVYGLGLRRVGGCRAWWIDGDFDPHTAALLEPYDDCPTCRGTLFFDHETLDRLVLKAHELGMQCSMHAIGDRAIEQSLTAYSKALKAVPRADHRHRIEHFDLPAPHQIEWARQLGVVLAVQPPFNHFWGHNDYLPLVGEERTERIDAFRVWREAGLMMGSGSDSTVTPLDPRIAIHAVVNHSQPLQRMGVTTALRMSTINNAYLAFEESSKGTLEEGKLADLTILGADPYLVLPDELIDIPLRGTIVGGETVWWADE